MTKSSDDNRANQLNPNNSAYWSSRQGGEAAWDGEDDEGWGAAQLVQVHCAIPPPTEVKRAYEFAFVGTLGQVRCLRVNFTASISWMDGRFDFDGYAERFARHLCSMFSRRWGGVSLQMVFDERGQEIRWLTSTWQADKPMTVGASDPLWPGVSLTEPGEALSPLEIVQRARCFSPVDWGEFAASEFEHLSMCFTHEDRCCALVDSIPATVPTSKAHP